MKTNSIISKVWDHRVVDSKLIVVLKTGFTPEFVRSSAAGENPYVESLRKSASAYASSRKDGNWVNPQYTLCEYYDESIPEQGFLHQFEFNNGR